MFPERQLFLRSEGRVNFVTFTTNMQMVVASSLFVLVVWLGVTSIAYLNGDAELEIRDARIVQLRNQKADVNEELGTLQEAMLERTETIEARQRLLEELNGIEPSVLPQVDTDPGQLVDIDDQASSKTSAIGAANAAALLALTPNQVIADGLENLEQRQLQLGQHMLNDTSAILSQIDNMLADTPLDTNSLIQFAGSGTNDAGVGGPYEPLEIDPAMMTIAAGTVFEALIEERRRLHLATLAMDSLPVSKPAADYYISSKFGTRRDPITKRWAKHSALDMAGWPGTAILAAGSGTVVKARWLGPYGNMIEIDHGNGFRTRYGHMRRLKVKKGEHVDVGQEIGEMGDTGRVTSTHLHYEVWLKGNVTDPMPYLKASEDVFEIKRRAAGKTNYPAS